jgi:hypothetical protein
MTALLRRIVCSHPGCTETANVELVASASEKPVSFCTKHGLAALAEEWGAGSTATADGEPDWPTWRMRQW